MFGRIGLASLVLLAAACAHAPQSAARKYAAAPTIQNPMLGKAQPNVPGMTSEGEAFMFSAFDGQQICFDGANHQSPAEATGTRYTLRFLTTDDVDLKNAPTLSVSAVQVLDSQSHLVPVMRTVEDTVRDRDGNVVATVSRQVQEMEPRYDTQLRICFPGPQQALTADARFMILLREVGHRGAFGIPMRPRSSWVWRFPAADTAGAPATTTN
jgi:hypothetical protein